MKKHWSVDEDKLVAHPEEHAVWKLEQRINFGIGERKIKKSELVKYWQKLDLDPYKRRALALALSRE
jgi:hypothetical protein